MLDVGVIPAHDGHPRHVPEVSLEFSLQTTVGGWGVEGEPFLKRESVSRVRVCGVGKGTERLRGTLALRPEDRRKKIYPSTYIHNTYIYIYIYVTHTHIYINYGHMIYMYIYIYP